MRDKPLSEIENRSGYCSQNLRRDDRKMVDKQVPVSNNIFAAALNDSFTSYLSPIAVFAKAPIAVSTPPKSVVVTSTVKPITVRRHKAIVANTSFMAPPLVLVFPAASAAEDACCKRQQYPVEICNSPTPCDRQPFNGLQFPPALPICQETASTLSILRSLDRWHASTASSLQKRLLSVQTNGGVALERIGEPEMTSNGPNDVESAAAESAAEEVDLDGYLENYTNDPEVGARKKIKRPTNPGAVCASTRSSQRLI